MKTSILSFLILSFLIFNSCNKDQSSVVIAPDIKITTSSVTLLTSSSCTAGGTITANSGINVTERGICYGTLASPTTSSNKIISGSGNGTFTCALTGLNPGILYYMRAYAIYGNNVTKYGFELEFKTVMFEPAGTVTDISGNTYNAIKIGTQTWMKENLKTTKYRDNTVIPNVTDNTAWNSLTTGAYSDYDNSVLNSDTYGRLYNVFAVSSIHNICPQGWHVPSDSEWNVLAKYLDNTVDTTNIGWSGEEIAGKLKEKGFVHWTDQTASITSNSSGFTALPGSERNGYGFSNLNYNGYWWTSTAYSSERFWYRGLYSFTTIWRGTSAGVEAGYSIRCVKD